MAAPLIFGGEPFGALQIGYDAMRTFRVNEISEFAKLASFAATALENARLHDITVRGARQLRLLHDVAARLTVADEPPEIARRVVTAARDLVSTRAGRPGCAAARPTRCSLPPASAQTRSARR